MSGGESMSTWLWIVFFIFVIISLIPVLKLEQVRSHVKYRVLWYLSISVFSWSVLTTLKILAIEYYFIYYFSILTYPLLFVISYLLYETFQTYMDKKSSTLFKRSALAFFIINLSVALTNPFHFLFNNLTLTEGISLNDFSSASVGIFFYIHVAVCYILLIIGFVKMLRYLKKSSVDDHDVFPFGMISASVILGITLNILHIFVYTFRIDPTYLFVVIISFILYTIIYKRDFNINLIISSQQYLFRHMREMYIISDSKENIIEISKNFKTRFKIEDSDYKNMKQLLYMIEKKAIIYEKKELILPDKFDPKKVYLNMEKQEFKVGSFKKTGFITLLYDETNDMKHIYEIEELRSHDMMTGLYNRNYLEENRVSFESKYPKMGVILLDVDGLKIYNDNLGHKAGDRLIRMFGKIISSFDNEYTNLIPVRLGGDEFLVIVKEATEDRLIHIINLIKEKTQDTVEMMNISFSYGYGLRKSNKDFMSVMLREADVMLYADKDSKVDYKEELKKQLSKQSGFTK